MQSIEKIIRPGTVSVGKKPADVFVRIQYTVDGHQRRLSFTGVVGPMGDGDCLGSCGQIDMSLSPEDFSSFADGWDSDKVAELLTVWQRWHLNDMRAECEHQRGRGETWKTHPSAKCPECGYLLGHAWLYEEVPSDIITWIATLPATDKQPAWI